MSVVLDVDFRTTRWEGLPPDQTRAGSLGNEFQLLGTTPRWYCSGWLTAPLADFVWEVQARLAEEDEGAWAVTFGNDNGEPGQGE
ncbi:MAG: hypothetical protein JO112_04485, partial [Planctomycetes bacterium]|nr:hypothetical protein [Planctomycetota bacterium]